MAGLSQQFYIVRGSNCCSKAVGFVNVAITPGTNLVCQEFWIHAAQNPYVHMLGHLSGRLFLRREAYKINQQAAIDACAEPGTWLELNAQPTRLDVDWRLWLQACGKGVKCAINCGAHSLLDAEFLRLGMGLARKGRLTRSDVVNTQDMDALRQSLRLKRSELG